MQELLQKLATKPIGEGEMVVYFYLGSKEYELTGAWVWPMQSEAVYCSDVMLSLPEGFIGTRGLIHPDDAQLVRDRVNPQTEGTVPFLQFRIITTYGEVKILTGRNLQFEEVAPFFDAGQMQAEQWKLQQDNGKGRQRESWQKRAADLVEKRTGTASWWMNADTAEVGYSDAVYEMHGLPSQGLNPHLHTFFPFIHPDDREIVIETLTQAIAEKLPLHIEYRLLLADETEKRLRLMMQWEFNPMGELMAYSTLQDVTEITGTEQEVVTTKDEAVFYKKITALHEQATGTAHWYINLVTRKLYYSDAFYRLHGLKPGVIKGNINTFLNFIHTDDRDIVGSAIKSSMQNHTILDLEYRIIRQDGKTRHVRQAGKMIVHGNQDMLMVFTVQDITVEKATEKKLAELKQEVQVKGFEYQQAEVLASMSSWLWDTESGEITWSEGAYQLLGYKPGTINLSQKHLLRAVHPDDQKRVTDELALAIKEGTESRLQFSLIRSGEVRRVAATFKLMPYEGRKLFLGILQDITVQYNLEQKLLHQAQLATSISENMLDRAVITDTENTIQLWNRTCEEIYGIKKDAAIGNNFFDVFPQLKNEEDLSLFNRALSGETISIKRTRGSLRREYHDLYMVPLMDDEGTVTGVLHILHDVSREVEIEQKLTERVNFIESLVEASVDRIIVMDRHMNYLYCNQKAADNYGLSKEELIGKNVLEVFPAAVNNPSYEHFRKALKGETVHIPAIEGLGGDDHTYQLYLVPIKDAAQNVSAVLWIHHDLGGEMKLVREQRRAAAIVNNIDALFIELDFEEKCLFINDTAEFYFGEKKEELIGKNIKDILPKDNIIGYNTVKKALTERVQAEVEYFCSLLQKWVFLSAVPSEDGVIILIYDRNDIKETQLRLQEEHQQLMEAQKLGQLGSFEWKVGEETVSWSDEMYRLSGMEPDSEVITPSTSHSFIHPDDLEEFERLKEASLINPGKYRLEHRTVGRDGVLRYVDHQFETIANEEGVIVRVYGTVQDITEGKLAEQEIAERTANLQESNEFVEEIMRTTPDLVTIYNTTSNEIIYTNHKNIWESHYKEAAEKTLMKDEDLIEAIHPDDVENAKAYLHASRLLKDGEVKMVDLRLQGDRWIRIRSSVFKRNEAGGAVEIISFISDITAYKNAELEIQKTLTILQQTEAVAQIGSWEYDIATGSFEWSEGMFRMFGLPQGVKVTPETYLDFAYEEDRSVAKRIIENLKKGDQPFEEQLRINKNGELRILKVKGSVVNNAEGQTKKMIGVDLDITDIKEAEKKASEQQDLLTQTAMATPDALIIFDLEKKEPVYLNNCLAEWLGYSSNELIEMGYTGRLQLIHKEDRKKLMLFNANLAKAKDNHIRSMVYRVHKKNGDLVWVRNRSKIFTRNSDGNPVQALSVLQDITKEKELYKQLSDRTRFVETLVDNSIDRIIVFDKDLKILAWNKRCEEQYGITKEKALSRSLTHLFPKIKEDAIIMYSVQQALSGEAVYLPAKKEIYTPLYSDAFFVPLVEENSSKPHAVLYILHDVTKKVESEQALKALNQSLEKKNQELESKNEEINSFAFVASHDLREPLRKIHTFSDWLLRREKENLSPGGKDYLNRICGATRRMEMLIEDVLVLSKINTIKKEFVPVDLNQIADQVKKELSSEITASNAVIEHDHLPTLLSNTNQLFYLFRNLIHNSIRFQKPGNTPHIKISAASVKGSETDEVKLDSETLYAAISVKDNGIGIENQYNAKIFKVFQQLQGKYENTGTGMGLAICRKVMENHKGAIAVKSAVGEGSVFTCYFPVAQ